MRLEELLEKAGKLEAKGSLEALDEARRLLFAASADFDEQSTKKILEAAARIQSEILEMMEDFELGDDEFEGFTIVDIEASDDTP